MVLRKTGTIKIKTFIMKDLFFVHINNHAGRLSLHKLKAREKKRLKKSYTIAGLVVGNELRIGISPCSVKDQFVKKIGRARAEGRARSNHQHMNYTIPEEIITTGKIAHYFLGICSKLKETLN